MNFSSWTSYAAAVETIHRRFRWTEADFHLQHIGDTLGVRRSPQALTPEVCHHDLYGTANGMLA
jgi:hypothetical protein